MAEWNPESQEDKTIEEAVAVTGQHLSVLSIQEEFQSIYDEIVQPDQVIVVPGYFVRYIPLLGLELACFQTTRRLKKER